MPHAKDARLTAQQKTWQKLVEQRINFRYTSLSFRKALKFVADYMSLEIVIAPGVDAEGLLDRNVTLMADRIQVSHALASIVGQLGGRFCRVRPDGTVELFVTR
jgi:hypothetical protein